MSKIEQRQIYRKLRASIPSELAAEWSRQITRDLLQILRYRAFDGTIYLYDALEGEPDLLSHLKQARFHIALPRVQMASNMTFHLWSHGDQLIESSLGLKEPSRASIETSPRPGDVAIVPSIAIDHKGCRLGFGGGFYDRWLARYRQDLALVIGVVFPPCFCQDPIEVEPHDMMVDLCLTGEQTVQFHDTQKINK